MNIIVVNVPNSLRALADPVLALHQSACFKTEPGEYGEGDLFIGMRMPQVRSIAIEYAVFSDEATLNPNTVLITGSVCGVR